MQTPDLTQLGIGGVIAYILVREVLGFLSRKSGNGVTSGEKSPEFWFNANRTIMSETLVASIVPVMQQQAQILNEMRAAAAEQTRVLIESQVLVRHISESNLEIRRHMADLSARAQARDLRDAQAR